MRKVREKVITSGTEGSNCEARVYLELKLRHEDLSQLEKQLTLERQRAHNGFKVLHYPVQTAPGKLTIGHAGVAEC